METSENHPKWEWGTEWKFPRQEQSGVAARRPDVADVDLEDVPVTENLATGVSA